MRRFSNKKKEHVLSQQFSIKKVVDLETGLFIFFYGIKHRWENKTTYFYYR